jgi:hypothetical protein
LKSILRRYRAPESYRDLEARKEEKERLVHSEAGTTGVGVEKARRELNDLSTDGGGQRTSVGGPYDGAGTAHQP